MALFERRSPHEMYYNHKLRLGRLFVSRGIAEASSILTPFIAIAATNYVFPKQFDALKCSVANNIILPNIDTAERMMDKLPAFEGPERAEARKSKSKEEIAKSFADIIVNDVFLATVGFAAQTVTQKTMDKRVSLPVFSKGAWGKHIGATAIDKTVQVGSFLLLNMNKPGQQLNESMQKTFASMISKIPVFDEKSTNDLSRYLANVGVPNTVGMLFSVGTLDRAYKNELGRIIGK